MKKNRQLHLWIGLLTSVLILIEAITGLLLTSPGLIGGQSHPSKERIQLQSSQMDLSQTEKTQINTSNMDRESLGGNLGQVPEFKNGNKGNGVLAVIKGLHAGRIGNTDVTWLVDLTAVAMIILTITGSYLSIKILKAQYKTNRLKSEMKVS